MFRLIIFCLFFCNLFFCNSLSAQAIDKEQELLSKTINIETIITAVSAADLEISDQLVSKSTTWTMNFFTGTSLEQRKMNLIIDLCREIGADILVDPQFTYSKRILGGGKLTVFGYPASYKNFRTMTDKQIDALITSPKFESNRVVFINK